MHSMTKLGIMGAVIAMDADPHWGHNRPARPAQPKLRQPSGTDRSAVKASRKQNRKAKTK
jgi:hypothetical protein